MSPAQSYNGNNVATTGLEERLLSSAASASDERRWLEKREKAPADERKEVLSEAAGQWTNSRRHSDCQCLSSFVILVHPPSDILSDSCCRSRFSPTVSCLFEKSQKKRHNC